MPKSSPATKGVSSGEGLRVGLKCTPRLYGARAGVWAQGGCWRVRTVRGGEDGFQGCMACLRSACGCTARHTRGVQGLKAVRRGLAHRKRSRGGDVVDDPSTAAPGRRLQPGRSPSRRTECQNVRGSSVKTSFALEISRPPLLPRESTCQATGEDFSG